MDGRVSFAGAGCIGALALAVSLLRGVLATGAAAVFAGDAISFFGGAVGAFTGGLEGAGVLAFAGAGLPATLAGGASPAFKCAATLGGMETGELLVPV